MKTINLLKRLEWSASYSYCTRWPSCPICNGIKPGHGGDEHGNMPDNQGHHKDCELKKVLDELIEEGFLKASLALYAARPYEPTMAVVDGEVRVRK